MTDPTVQAALIQAAPQFLLVVAACIGAGWAVYNHHKRQRLEAARWLQQLYSEFYNSVRFDEMRIGLEYRYLGMVAPIIQKRISDRHLVLSQSEQEFLRHFDNFLNYFENILYMLESKQVRRSDVLAMFEYWMDLMRSDPFGILRAYTAFGFERLAGELGAVPVRHVFLTDRQLAVVAQQAPALSARLGTGQSGSVRIAGESPGVRDLDLSCEVSATGRLFAFDDTREGVEAAGRLDAVLDFDPMHSQLGACTRMCVRAYAPDSGVAMDAWAYFRSDSSDQQIGGLQQEYTVSLDVSGVTHLVLYGSLRRSEPDFATLRLDEGLRHVGPTQIRGAMIDLGAYPGVYLDGEGEFTGELYEVVDPEVFKRLDQHELFNPNDTRVFNRRARTGSLYIRRVAATTAGVRAFVYVYNGEEVEGGVRTGPVVPHGDWLRHQSERRG